MQKVNSIDRDSKLKRKTYILFAIFISVLLILPKDITWAKDRLNYLVYADTSWIIMQRYLSRGIITFLSNEPLFLAINILLSKFFLPETTLKIIIFLGAFGTLYSLGKLSKHNFLVLIFFLLVPQILKNHITHLRQGLALSVYLLGVTSNGKKGKLLKYSSIFIHTSFAFILLFEFLEVFFKKIRFDSTLRIIVSTIALTIFIFLIPYIAGFLGDRRALSYSFSKVQGSSGLGFILWAFVGIYFILKTRKDYMNIIVSYGIIFYVVSYFFIDFGARVFENIVPVLMALSITDERKSIRLIYILFFTIYGCLQWYMRGGINF